MKSSNIKQVIVMRKDLNMRKGKIAAQAAHASMKVILDMMSLQRFTNENIDVISRTLTLDTENPVQKWLSDEFKKICVYVKSEDELMSIYIQSKNKEIPTSLIEDKGLTEFKGIKTKTCIAIGPWWSDNIDEITGNLPLL